MTRLPHQPRLRIQERGHRQAAWSELFYDLAFVVIVAQLAHHLAAHLNLRGLTEFILLFIPVWWAWTGEVYYTTRFDSDADKAKRLIGTIQLVSLVVLAGAVGLGLEKGALLFAAGYALVRTMQLAELWRAGRFIPAARPFTTYFTRGYGVGVAIWWVSLLLPAELRPWAWAAGLLTEVGTSLLAGDLHRRFPPHVSHLPERFGLFVILVLGESFAGSVRGLIERPDAEGLLRAGLGVLIAVAVWWTYFDRLDDEAVKALAREGRSRPYLVWLYAHLPLALGVTALGVATELSVAGHEAGHDVPIAWFLAGALALYLAAEATVCATAVGAGRPTLAMTWGVRLRLASIPVVLLIPVLTHQPDWFLGLSAVVLWLIVLGDARLEQMT